MKKTAFLLITTAGLGIFYSAGLLWRSAYGIGAAILLFTSFFIGKKLLEIKALEKKMILFLTSVFCIFALPLLYHHAELREYDRFSRILAMIPIFILFLHHFPSEKILISLFALGTISALVFAGLNANGTGRFGGAHHPIQFGDLALLTGFFALALLPCCVKQRIFVVIAWAGFLAGVAASILSGSRGGWLALFPAITVLFCHFFPHASRQKMLCVGALGVVILALLPEVQARFFAACDDLKAFANGDVNTSLGLRLEMWRAGVLLFAEKPFFGWGSAGLLQAVEQLSSAGAVSVQVKQFTHLHNDYLDFAARFGLVGLAGLLLFYGVPLCHFILLARRGVSLPKRSFATMGILLCTGFMVFSLTQSVLSHHSGMIFYLIGLACAMRGCVK